MPELPGGGRVEGRLRLRGSECCWICWIKLRLSAGTVCTVASEWQVDEVWELCMEWNRSAVETGEETEEEEVGAVTSPPLLSEMPEERILFGFAGQTVLELGNRPGYGLAP